MVLLRNSFFLLSIVTFLRLGSACSSSSSCFAASLAWAKRPTGLLYNTCSPRLLGWPLHLGETLPPWKSKEKKCCLFKTPYVAAPMRQIGDVIVWTTPYAQLSMDAPTRKPEFLMVLKGRVSEETCLIISRLPHPFSTRKSTSKSGTQKDYLLCLRSLTESTFKCLFKKTLLWHGIMSRNLRNPKDHSDHKKRLLSNQPRCMYVTPPALLGSWVLQLIKDMKSLGTDFETHA